MDRQVHMVISGTIDAYSISPVSVPVWPDWAIYCTFGQLFKAGGKNYLPTSPIFIAILSSAIILGNFDFLLVTLFSTYYLTLSIIFSISILFLPAFICLLIWDEVDLSENKYARVYPRCILGIILNAHDIMLFMQSTQA